ncbi:MAG TPA: type II toxin-antitoxin system VapC family toxin [Terriglobia bacterium]|nr:type II toxin-antitoxin system VapC family toxin [Terriglobia bacterium]
MKPADKQSYVLDASALLAYLQREPGYNRVSEALARGAAASAVNLSEVYAKVTHWALPLDEVADRLAALGLETVDFTEEDARAAGNLYPSVKSLGLSLADRACLALGVRLGVPVMTTDRAWKRVNGIQVELLR